MTAQPASRETGETALVGLFPDGSYVDGAGELTVAGLSLMELADTYGTPAYVVDEDAMVGQALRARTALAARWPRSKVLFASKAFPCTAAYRAMAGAGVGMDVAGGGALAAALAAGADPAEMVLHGNAKTLEELHQAVDAGVGTIVIDNLDDIDRLERIVQHEQRVLVRLVPGVRADTHEAMSTGQAGSKFGLSGPAAQRAIGRLRNSARLELAGVHMHIGSQIRETRPFTEAVRALAGFGEFDVYDLGGGLGVRYTYADDPPSVEQWVSALADAAQQHLPATAQLMIEPGRSLVARAGITLYRVISIKAGSPTFVAVDGGMGDNMEIALYGQRFEATIANRVGGGAPVDLVGRHCESGDRISTGVALRDPVVGDVIAVPTTGAYCYTLANNYNGARRPPVVFCRDGSARLVVRRETYDDLLLRDQPHR
ncbi:MAG: diaminopimelate decarboxylase [Sciscionella sp.]